MEGKRMMSWGSRWDKCWSRTRKCWNRWRHINRNRSRWRNR